MSNYNWPAIKKDYEKTATPLRQLAEKYGLKSASAISKKAKKEDWRERPVKRKQGHRKQKKKTCPVSKPRKEYKKAQPGDKRLGSKSWMARSSSGRNPIFDNADELWDACVEYFEYIEANPLRDTKAYVVQGQGVEITKLDKMRAMTLSDLCVFLGIDFTTWCEYRKRKGFEYTTWKVDEIVKNQKFQGAAAGLLNASIIARDLGLVDKKEIAGLNQTPMQKIDKEVDQAEAASVYRENLSSGVVGGD